MQELEDGNLKVKVEIPEGMQQLRLDPVEEPCIISIEHIYNAQGEEKEKIETNGVELSNKIFSLKRVIRRFYCRQEKKMDA